MFKKNPKLSAKAFATLSLFGFLAPQFPIIASAGDAAANTQANAAPSNPDQVIRTVFESTLSSSISNLKEIYDGNKDGSRNICTESADTLSNLSSNKSLWESTNIDPSKRIALTNKTRLFCQKAQQVPVKYYAYDDLSILNNCAKTVRASIEKVLAQYNQSVLDGQTGIIKTAEASKCFSKDEKINKDGCPSDISGNEAFLDKAKGVSAEAKKLDSDNAVKLASIALACHNDIENDCKALRGDPKDPKTSHSDTSIEKQIPIDSINASNDCMQISTKIAKDNTGTYDIAGIREGANMVIQAGNFAIDTWLKLKPQDQPKDPDKPANAPNAMATQLGDTKAGVQAPVAAKDSAETTSGTGASVAGSGYNRAAEPAANNAHDDSHAPTVSNTSGASQFGGLVAASTDSGAMLASAGSGAPNPSAANMSISPGGSKELGEGAGASFGGGGGAPMLGLHAASDLGLDVGDALLGDKSLGELGGARDLASMENSKQNVERNEFSNSEQDIFNVVSKKVRELKKRGRI